VRPASGFGQLWINGAVLAIGGGGAVGAVVGAISGVFVAGVAGFFVGAIFGGFAGVLAGSVGSITAAPALAWFLNRDEFRRRPTRVVVRGARLLVAFVTVVVWFVVWSPSGGSYTAASFWWLLLVMLAFGWWATGRVVVTRPAPERARRPARVG
jgi:hypothetical protein